MRLWLLLPTTFPQAMDAMMPKNHISVNNMCQEDEFESGDVVVLGYWLRGDLDGHRGEHANNLFTVIRRPLD